MKLKEKKYLSKLIDKYEKKDSTKYLLSPNSFSNEDIINGIKILLSKRITMSEMTKKFEYEFAKYMGVKYALMVNSGSTANLLSTFALINPLKKNRLISVLGKYAQTNIRREYTAADDPIKGEKEFSKAGKML